MVNGVQVRLDFITVAYLKSQASDCVSSIKKSPFLIETPELVIGFNPLVLMASQVN